MMQDMYTAMGISPEVYEYGEQTLVSLKDRFDEIDKTCLLYTSDAADD